MNGGAIVDPRQIESNRSVVNGHPFIAQCANTETIELVQPVLRAREVLVIAGHEVDAVPSLELRQRRDRRS